MKELVAFALFAAAVACTPSAPPPAPAAPPAPPPAAAPPPPPMDAKAEAAQIFSQRCAACHGAAGKGDGPAAAGLPVKPRDYSDGAWQKSIDDATLSKVIVEGGPAIGKSPLMTPNPDLKDKPEVVKELVAAIRAFAPKG